MKKQTKPSVKAHLLRSGFSLLSLLAVCVIPFALGQQIQRSHHKDISTRTTNVHRPTQPSTLCQVIGNSGFETGSLPPWTDTGDTSFTSVSTTNPHSGAYSLETGPSTSDGFIDQVIPTVAGAAYDVSFWLENDDTSGNNRFGASFGGVTLVAEASQGQFGYTLFTFHNVTPGANADLHFIFYNPPSYFHLDDVCVTPSGGSTPTARYDFNGDGHPDFMLYNASTRRTAIWYLNNNVYIGGAYGPTLPAGWTLIDAADFNGDGHPDYLLYNASRRQTAIWYLNNNVYVSGVYGPTVPNGWQPVGAADFNGDGKPDYVLYNATAQQTAMWYLNNNVYVSGVYGPTLPGGWSLVGLADFNGDGNSDYVLLNSTTRQSAIWYLINNVYLSGVYAPTVPSGWQLVATADFNGDGHPDYVLFNSATQQSAIWHLNNNAYMSGVYAPTLPAGWTPGANYGGGGGGLCDFRLTPTGANALPGGGYGSFVVGCNYSSCCWSASSLDPSMITLVGTTSYCGPNTITYSVAANTTGQPRTGSIYISPAGLTFTVSQSAGNSDWNGTWAGTYTYTFTSNCTYQGGGNIQMTFSVNGTTVSGNDSMDGIECLDQSTCNFIEYDSSTGSLSGTVSGNTISVNYNGTDSGCSGASWYGSFSGTRSGSTITGDLYIFGMYDSHITLTKQ